MVYLLVLGAKITYTPLGEKEQNHETWDIWRTLRGHTKDVMHVAWSPDGNSVASCGIDNLVLIWQLSSSAVTPRRLNHNGMVKGVSWDPVGKYLAAQVDGGEEKATVVWRVRDWQVV
jgi:protein HIRA/HIR1